MPRFFLDLFFDRYVVLDPGGMLFEHATSAAAAADEMARHLVASRPAAAGYGSGISAEMKSADPRSILTQPKTARHKLCICQSAGNGIG
jgi:hypothetical protein